MAQCFPVMFKRKHNAHRVNVRHRRRRGTSQLNSQPTHQYEILWRSPVARQTLSTRHERHSDVLSGFGGSHYAVSVNLAGTGSGQLFSGANRIGMSADGRFIAFDSIASDLVANDPDTVHDGTTQDFSPRPANSTTRLLALHTISAVRLLACAAGGRNGNVVVFCVR